MTREGQSAVGTSSSRTSSSKNLPNLYGLLGLSPLESNTEKILCALKAIREQAHVAQAGEPRTAKQLIKLFELGKTQLLSSEQKSRYDARWQAVYGNNAEVAELLLVWDTTELEKLLPSGDFRSEFDLHAFLESSVALPACSSEADFQKLLSLVTSQTTSPPATLAVTHSQVHASPATGHLVRTNGFAGLNPSPTAGGSQELVSQRVTQEEKSVTQARVAAKSAIRKPRSVPPQKQARKMRQRRDRSLFLMVGGVLASLMILLGILSYLLQTKDSPQPQNQTVAMQPAQPAVGAADVTRNLKPRRSGLPKVRGLDNDSNNNDTNKGGYDDGDMAPNPFPGFRQPPDSNASIRPELMQPSMDQPSPDNQIPQNPIEPNSNMPAVSGMDSNAPQNPVSDLSPTTPTQPVADPEPMLSDAEKAEWSTDLTRIREFIGMQDFTAAEKGIVALESKPKTQPQRDQLRRLATLLKLAREFKSGLDAAISGLSVGVNFNVSGNPVSFVEGTDTRIVIRREGRNEAFDLPNIPMALAYGLVDLKLDIAHASTLAKKAAFAIVHPRSSELVRPKAKQWMQEAIDFGIVDKDMMLAFDDNYEL